MGFLSKELKMAAAAIQPVHKPHYQSVVNFDNLLVPAMNGLIKYRNSDHAVTNGHMHHVTRELQPKLSPGPDFFGKSNNFIDVELPQDMHYLDNIDLLFEFTNKSTAGGSNLPVVFENMVSNLFSKIEVRVNSETIETITDLESYFGQLPYHKFTTLGKKEDTDKIDSGNFEVDFSIPVASTSSVRVPMRNVLNTCTIPTVGIDGQVTLRFHSQVASQVVDEPSELALTGFKIHARENRVLDSQMAQALSSNIDWRYLQPKLEEKTVALTTATVKTVLNNYTADDLCSHMWVLLRASNPTGVAKDKYLTDVIDRLWLEDENGVNISDGIQWSQNDLTRRYLDKFNNSGVEKQGLYLALCPASDPPADYNKGSQTGVTTLSRNIKVCTQTYAGKAGTYYMSVVAMCHKHVRLADGRLTIQ